MTTRALAALSMVAACVQTVPPTAPDAASDAAPDVPLDAAPDATPDTPLDAAPDATLDATPDDIADAAVDADFGDTRDVLDAGCALTMCGVACVDTRVSSSHCGACFNRCYSGPCVGGYCPCASGLTRCADRCVDLARDNESCGACGGACAAGTRCEEGACAPCPSGYLRCAGDSVGNVCGEDTTANLTRCGGCGRACGVNPGGTRDCIAGRCVFSCAEGSADCEGELDGCETSPSTSRAHCGACGRACEADALCVGGRCVAVPVRPVAPISMVTVTSRRPWLRWELPAGADGARVELCAARDCAVVTASWDMTGDRGRPAAALAPGDHYWRLRARRGATVDAAAGPTWMFTVPSEIPSSWTPRPDFDGDGRDDAVQLVTPSSGEVSRPWSFTVRMSSNGVTHTRYGVAPPAPSYIMAFASIGRPHAWLDVNGDGYGELGLVAEQYLGYIANDARAYLGGPSGIEATPSHSLNVHWGYGGGPGALPVALGDVNGDGYGDVGFVTTSRGPGSTEDIVVFTVDLGRGPQSSAASARSYPGNCASGAVARGDFNADGFTDLVMARCGFFASEHLWVAMGGVAEAGVSLELTGCAGEPFAAPSWRAISGAHDVDDDGYDDLAYSDGRWFRGGPDGLTDARCGVVTRAM